MLYRCVDKTLEKMEADPEYNGGFSRAIANRFRLRIAEIRAADNENILLSIGSLHFEKLKGNRRG